MSDDVRQKSTSAPAAAPVQAETRKENSPADHAGSDDLDEDSLNFAPEEHIRQVPVALDLEDEAMQDTNSLDSKPQLEGVSERGRARRVNVGNGFLSFDPASHFENTEAVLRMMEEHLEALKDGGESAVAKAPDTTTLRKAPVNTPRSTFDALHAFQMAGAKLLAEKQENQNQESPNVRLGGKPKS
jgi:hypothetical protein